MVKSVCVQFTQRGEFFFFLYLCLKERLNRVRLFTPDGGKVGSGGEGLEPFVDTKNHCH